MHRASSSQIKAQDDSEYSSEYERFPSKAEWYTPLGHSILFTHDPESPQKAILWEDLIIGKNLSFYW